jgi:hypothetical protein
MSLRVLFVWLRELCQLDGELFHIELGNTFTPLLTKPDMLSCTVFDPSEGCQGF